MSISDGPIIAGWLIAASLILFIAFSHYEDYKGRRDHRAVLRTDDKISWWKLQLSYIQVRLFLQYN